MVDPPRKGLDAGVLTMLTGPFDQGLVDPGEPSSTSQQPSAAAEALPGAACSTAAAGQQSKLQAGQSNRVRRLVYLSCGFPALMRDTDVLLGAGWRLTSATAYFFFPGTDSLETLVVFDRG